MPTEYHLFFGGLVMWEHIGPIMAVAGFLLQFFAIIGTGIWKLSQVESRLREAIDASGREIDERIDAQARQFGETALALRQKITDVELYVRDNYVRRESFYSNIQELAKRIETRIDRLETKIEKGAS